MKIRIKENARDVYIMHAFPVNWEWADIMGQIAGMELEVETDYLFKDQYNTAPIPGISESGLRVMQNVVEEVIDDVRPLYLKCHWCGKMTLKPAEVCSKCGKTEYLDDMEDKVIKHYVDPGFLKYALENAARTCR